MILLERLTFSYDDDDLARHELWISFSNDRHYLFTAYGPLTPAVIAQMLDRAGVVIRRDPLLNPEKDT